MNACINYNIDKCLQQSIESTEDVYENYEKQDF